MKPHKVVHLVSLRQILLIVGIATVAVNLRCSVTSTGSVLGEITRAWRLSGFTAGILTALPVATFAAVGALVPTLARQFSSERLVAGAMLLAAAGLSVRALAGSVQLFLAATTMALAGAAIGNVLLPPLVKRYFPAHVGAMTALYSTALAIGMAGGAALTVPAEHAFGGGWRTAVGIWAVPAALAAQPWVVLAFLHRRAGGRAHSQGDSRPRVPVHRSGVARALVVFFGCQSLNAYVVLGWLPTILADAGLDARSASVALVVVGSLSIPVSLLLPGLAASRPAQYRLVTVTTVAYATGYIGLLCAPGMLVWLWAALLGIGNGAFPLSVTMIGLRSRQPRVTTALSGLVQGGGYLLAITGPMLVSALHQSSGGWRVPLLALLGTLVLQLVSGMRAAMPRTVESELGIAACHIAPRS